MLSSSSKVRLLGVCGPACENKSKKRREANPLRKKKLRVSSLEDPRKKPLLLSSLFRLKWEGGREEGLFTIDPSQARLVPNGAQMSPRPHLFDGAPCMIHVWTPSFIKLCLKACVSVSGPALPRIDFPGRIHLRLIG